MQNYNNFRPQGKGYYPERNFGNQGFQQHEQFKKSGCTLKKKDGSHFMYGWNKSRRGLLTFVASPRKDASKRKTKNPNWENWAVKLTFPDRKVEWTNGLFDCESQRLHLTEYNLIANPNTGSGRTRSGKTVKGYFGRRSRG